MFFFLLEDFGSLFDNVFCLKGQKLWQFPRKDSFLKLTAREKLGIFDKTCEM